MKNFTLNQRISRCEYLITTYDTKLLLVLLVLSCNLFIACKTQKAAQKGQATQPAQEVPRFQSNGLIPPNEGQRTVQLPKDRRPIEEADTTVKNNYKPKDLNLLTEADLAKYYKDCKLFVRGFQMQNVDKMCDCLGRESIATVEELKVALYHCSTSK